jgi:hypothetical protein
MSIFDGASIPINEPFFKALGYSAVKANILRQYKEVSTQLYGDALSQSLPRSLHDFLVRQDLLHNATALFSSWAFAVNEDYTPRGTNPVEHVSIRGSDLLIGRSGTGDEYHLTHASRVEGYPPYFSPEHQPLISYDVTDDQVYTQFLGSYVFGPLAVWSDPEYVSHSLDIRCSNLVNSRVYQYAMYRVMTRYDRHHLAATKLIFDYGSFPSSCSHTDLVSLGVGGCIRRYRKVLFDTSNYAGLVDRYTGTSLQDSYLAVEVDASTEGWEYLGTYYPMYAFSLSQVPGVATEIIRGIDYGLGNPRFPVFNIIADRDAGEAAGILPHAAADAANTAIGDLEINALEHILEIQDLFGLVSTHELMSVVADLMRHIRHAKKLGFKFKPGKLLWSTLNFLADARLVYSFALAPSYDDAAVIADTAMGVRAGAMKYLNGANMVTYGKDYWDLGDYYPDFSNMEILGRSKLVFRPEPDSWLISLLPLKTVGLYAELSSIWETIPFSFVVDKFLDVGGLLETVDNTRTMMALNVLWSENSLTFRWRFDEEFLTLIGATHQPAIHEDDLEAPHFRAYYRLAMRSFPAFIPSRMYAHTLSKFDEPDWLTTGALLYRLGFRQ